MIGKSAGDQMELWSHDEKVGKVFLVVGNNARRCLICDQLFTQRSSFDHCSTICYPLVSNAN
jgi:hypothetical protein